MTLSFELTAAQEQALAETARRLQVRPEELAAAAIRDLVAQPTAEFDAVARLVLEKNTELYRRLA
jgi:hypothetical protein